jgi:hypothetical protein
MLFALAGHLGCTVAWLERNMGASELAEWMSLLGGDDPDPWGHYRMDSHMLALTGFTVAAPHGKPSDLMDRISLPWKPKDRHRKASPRDIEQFMSAIGAKKMEV